VGRKTKVATGKSVSVKKPSEKENHDGALPSAVGLAAPQSKKSDDTRDRLAVQYQTAAARGAAAGCTTASLLLTSRRSFPPATSRQRD
jgi:hypothetical protein